MSEEYIVFTFPSTHHALRAEKVLNQNNYNIPLAPIPRELTSNCGEVIRVKPGLKDDIIKLLQQEKVEIEDIHLIQPRQEKGLLDKFFGF